MPQKYKVRTRYFINTVEPQLSGTQLTGISIVQRFSNLTVIRATFEIQPDFFVVLLIGLIDRFLS